MIKHDIDFLKQDIGFLLRRTYQALKQRLLREMEPLGITFNQFQVLAWLLDGDNIPQKTLAQRASIDYPTMTRMLRRMERDGLITRIRDTRDTRVQRVLLTDRGRSLRGQIALTRIASLNDTLACLSPKEVAELRRMLNALYAHNSQQPDPAQTEAGTSTTERRRFMLEEEKAKGRALAHLPPPERNKRIARMMFGESAAQAQMAMFMLMGSWGIAPEPPSGAGGPPMGKPPNSREEGQR